MNAEAAALPRCDTGTSGLDHILGGGFPPHALYLLQRDPGVGKTTLAMQFLLAGSRRGESCLYVTGKGRGKGDTDSALDLGGGQAASWKRWETGAR
jgi:predicted ATP-dependent serine protease